MPTFMTFLLRLFLLLAGLVVAASLAVAAVIVLALWGVRAVWARLTGRPVMPFVVHVDPRGGFERMVRRPARGGAPPRADAVRAGSPIDVTDVEPK